MNIETTQERTIIEAIFLDRDGVIIHNRANYVRDISDVRFYPTSLLALRRLNQIPNPPKIYIVTNQSSIGRGILSFEKYNEISQYIQKVILSHGGKIEKIYFCPHAPFENCECRKPKPGLILEAIKKYNHNIHNTMLIGDARSDIEAGYAAGIRNLYFVKTGRGNKQLPFIKELPYFDLVKIHKNFFEIVKTVF
ncbi:MAG: HAD-IIIA family hydrolase [Chloroflexota bacterium]